MAASVQSKHLQDGVVAGRLGAAKTRENFQDIHPPLSAHEALVAEIAALETERKRLALD